MIQVPGAEENPALPVAIGVDGVLGKTAVQVKGALQGPRQGLERQREENLEVKARETAPQEEHFPCKPENHVWILKSTEKPGVAVL